MRTKNAKVMLTARVPSVVKEVIRAERGNQSDGEFLAALVAANVRTAKGKESLARWAESNPLVRALLGALPKTTLLATS